MGRKSLEKDNRARRYIRILDDDKWVEIDRLQTLSKYKNSFNKIINEALDYGLPLLIKAEFGGIDENGEYIPEEPIKGPPQEQIDMYYRLDELLQELIFLIEEISLNVTINKAVVCSLFNAKEKEVHGKPIPAICFSGGDYRDTPQFMEKFEMKYLKELERRRNNTE